MAPDREVSSSGGLAAEKSREKLGRSFDRREPDPLIGVAKICTPQLIPMGITDKPSPMCFPAKRSSQTSFGRDRIPGVHFSGEPLVHDTIYAAVLSIGSMG
jgi:hypothetical protein